MKKLLHWLKYHTAIPSANDQIPEGNKASGIIVRLVRDENKQEYEIVCPGSISRGPMRQFKPCISFLCRRPMFGYENEGFYDYWWFRKDSLKFIR